MLVMVDDALFGAANTVGLLQLMDCCQRPLGKPMHRLVAAGPKITAWIASQSTELQADWALAVAAGVGVEATDPAAQVVVVRDGDDQWDRPPRLSLATAIKVLRRPLAIVCEDSVSDQQFVTAIVPPNQRAWFDTLVEHELIVFEETGSIDKFDRLLRYPRSQAFRAFAIMDSDAMVAGHPSQSAVRAVGYCDAARVRYHRLAWRFAENYLSAAALQLWCSQQPHLNRPDHQRRIAALASVPADVRNHYNMKFGDRQDRRRLPSEPAAAQATWTAQREAFTDKLHGELAEGFDKHVNQAFDRDHGVAPGAEVEVAALFASIRECL